MTIEEYLDKNASPTQRAEYERIRGIVKQLVPDVEEVITYGIPTFKHQHKYVLYFAAYKDHMSLHGDMKSVEDRLGDYKISKKGTVHFTEAKPLPQDIIEEIITNRLQKI